MIFGRKNVNFVPILLTKVQQLMAGSSMKYAWPCTVNVANFVTVKPSVEKKGDDEFRNWREQMLCLLESQDVLGFVDGEIQQPPTEEEKKAWRRTDRLVKGWMLGSIGRDALHAVSNKETARDVWLELHAIFKDKYYATQQALEREEEEIEKEQEEEEAVEEEEAAAVEKDEESDENKGNSSSRYLTLYKAAQRGVNSICSAYGDSSSRYLTLYKAAQRGDWDTIKNFFGDTSINESISNIISPYSETALHVAVLTGKANSLVNKLVEIMPLEALERKNHLGYTALHNAAIVGNTAAAFALVERHPALLLIPGYRNDLPVIQASIFGQQKTLEYLISQHEHEPNTSLFEGQLGVRLLTAVISSQLTDIALDLALKYPNLALLRDPRGDSALSIIALAHKLFLSTETFSWWQTFIYNRIPLKKSTSEADAAHTTSDALDIENLSSKCNSTSSQIIRGVGKKLEPMIWHAVEIIVPKVKELREKKARHQQALQLVEYLCNQIASRLPQIEASRIFESSIMRAARCGISEVVEIIIHTFPSVVYHDDPMTGMDIFLVAATHRFENVFNLINSMSDRKYIFFSTIDKKRNNLLHICGNLAPPHRLNLVAGAALQMQRELQWFKEMENFVHPHFRTWLNMENKTPQMVFTEQHEKLKADGEQWMKDTASACTISAALIATVVFAAAFTVPGGIESATGIPLLSGDHAFRLFAVSDAVSFFTSITSLLMFLSILTSRYAEQDFLYSLPKRLAIGLLSLFISITFMLLAFSATLYLLFQRDIAWFGVLVAALACLPVTSFVMLQFPLLVDVIYSTYGPGILGKKTDRLIY